MCWPGRILLGARLTTELPMVPPCSSPWQICATSCRPARCWGRRPGELRLALMLDTRMGLPVMTDRAADILRIWPPPSSMLPSISMPPSGSKTLVCENGTVTRCKVDVARCQKRDESCIVGSCTVSGIFGG